MAFQLRTAMGTRCQPSNQSNKQVVALEAAVGPPLGRHIDHSVATALPRLPHGRYGMRQPRLVNGEVADDECQRTDFCYEMQLAGFGTDEGQGG